MFKLDNFSVILFVSFSYKQLLQYSIIRILKIDFSAEKIQKSLCITTKSMNNFKRNYLENYNDSEFTVKTKNAPFFMNFSNINKVWLIFLTGGWSYTRKVTLSMTHTHNVFCCFSNFHLF